MNFQFLFEKFVNVGVESTSVLPIFDEVKRHSDWSYTIKPRKKQIHRTRVDGLKSFYQFIIQLKSSSKSFCKITYRTFYSYTLLYLCPVGQNIKPKILRIFSSVHRVKFFCTVVNNKHITEVKYNHSKCSYKIVAKYNINSSSDISDGGHSNSRSMSTILLISP